MRFPVVALLVVAVALLAIACNREDNTLKDQRERSGNARGETFARAESLFPLPRNENFPLRQALVEFTKRQDLISHPTFVYVLADTGQILGYYVAKSYPVNLCAFLSTTESVRDDDQGNLILTAPSLDGIYYGGAGASSSCNGWFFFDNATNALIELIGVKLFIADQPLRVEAQQFSVIVNP